MGTDSNQIVVRLMGLAVGGAAVGEVTEGPPGTPGMKAFIRDVIPGEIVRATIQNRQERFLEANLIEVVSPSPHRRSAPCRYNDSCGGCDLQHMSVVAQREEKRRMIEGMLQRQGRIEVPGGVELLGGEIPEFRYRTRVSLHIDEQGSIGFFRRGTGSVVDIDECLLAQQAIQERYRILRPLLQRTATWIYQVTFDQPGGKGPVHVIASVDERLTVPQNFLEISEVAALRKSDPLIRFQRRGRDLFEAPSHLDSTAGHFSQVNPTGNQLLLQAVLDAIGAGEVTELYAGAGNFSLPLARRGVRVEAVEVDPALVELGVECAHAEGLSERVQFFTMSCEQFLAARQPKPIIILDPPRSGAKDVVTRLRAPDVRQIVYISCDLPTLVRDLKSLVAQGFLVQRVRFVDMFAQTHHVEVVVELMSRG